MEIGTQIYWLGYDIAMGYDSIGWMQVSKSDIEIYKTMSDDEILDSVKELTTTDQWDYQIYSKIREILQNEKSNYDAYLDRFIELQDYAIAGYMDAIVNLLDGA